jgi:hypothetical protein
MAPVWTARQIEKPRRPIVLLNGEAGGVRQKRTLRILSRQAMRKSFDAQALHHSGKLAPGGQAAEPFRQRRRFPGDLWTFF